jgi:gas vesicle protein
MSYPDDESQYRPPAETGEESPEELQEDIEQTREAMSATIDALQERLSAESLKAHAEALKYQAAESIREATIGKAENMVSDVQEKAVNTGETIIGTIKANPIPAALTALGVAWLIKDARSESSQRRYSAYGMQPQSEQGGMSQTFDQVQSKGGELVGRVEDTASQMSGQVQSQISQVSNQAQQQAQQLSNQIQRQAQQLSRDVQQMYQSNPLGMGLAAFVLGAAVGFLVPETPQESQLMGETRDSLMSQAQSVAEDTMQKVQNVAQEAKGAAHQEAQEQGLTG